MALVNSRYSGAISGFDHPGLNVADGNGQCGKACMVAHDTHMMDHVNRKLCTLNR